MDEPAIAEARKTLDHAMRYSFTWHQVAATVLGVASRMLPLAKKGVKTADEAVPALELLRTRKLIANGDEALAEILDLRLKAAMMGVQAHSNVLAEAWDRKQMRGDNMPAEALREPASVTILETPAELKVAHDDLVAYRKVLDRFAETCRDPNTPSAIRPQLKSMLPMVAAYQAQSSRSLRIMQANAVLSTTERLIRMAHDHGLQDVIERTQSLRNALHHRGDEVPTALSALDAKAHEGVGEGAEPQDRLSAEDLAKAIAVVDEYGSGVARVGTLLCLDAAALIKADDTSGLWQAMTEVSLAIAAYRENLLDVCERAGGTRPSPSSSGTAPSAPVSERVARPTGGASGPSRKPRKGRKGAGGASVAAPAEPSLPVTPAPGADAKKQADMLLKKYPSDRLMAAHSAADVLEVARGAGKDTASVANMMRDPKRDAVKTADFVRGMARGWFGEAGPLRRLQAALPAGDERVAQLTERLRALELMEHHLNAWEADELKCDRLPRLNHLDRLLKAAEIQHVGAPVRLPSAGDVGERGLLFEIAIQPKPLSNRTAALPLFVHLHLAEPVEASALSTLEYSDFARVHLKTKEQRALGAKWEDTMHRLGNTEAKVHREQIGPRLLSELFARIQTKASVARA
ncbi:hypothetical protein [Ralstonia psammae]|uniref:hypothetical protein n=1 Tax=Ralstonia psammae TaxID=3058598 RepID=UPI00292FF5B4|nr:hypothetical protein [Ralstonia sp. LMG 19083]